MIPHKETKKSIQTKKIKLAAKNNLIPDFSSTTLLEIK